MYFNNCLGSLHESLFNIGLLKALKENLNFHPYWLKEYENYPLIGDTLKNFQTPPTDGAVKKVPCKDFTNLSLSLPRVYIWKTTFRGSKKHNFQVFFYYEKPIPIEDDKDFYLQRFGEKFKNNLKWFTSETKGSLLHVDLFLHLTVGKSYLITVADLSLYGASELFDYYECLKDEPTYPKGLERLSEFDLKAMRLVKIS